MRRENPAHHYEIIERIGKSRFYSGRRKSDHTVLYISEREIKPNDTEKLKQMIAFHNTLNQKS